MGILYNGSCALIQGVSIESKKAVGIWVTIQPWRYSQTLQIAIVGFTVMMVG